MSDPIRSEARVETTLAQRYMTQLCKHFAHRLPVHVDDTAGSIEFASGACRLEASAELLVLRVEAPNAMLLGEVEGTVARHLVRFAFRDAPEIAWRRAGA